MNSNIRVILAVACLALAALACQTVMGGASTSTPSPKVILSDDFSSSKWGTGTDSDSSIEYKNQALEVIIFTRNYIVWTTPNKQDYQNIHMEVTVLNNNTAPSTAFGLLCNRQASVNSSFYYFVIRPAGQYAIVKATQGESDVFLTNNNGWGSSDLISKNASSYHLGVDCGNGTLALYVDGQQVASVSDATYTSGSIGLLTWSGEEATNTDVSFDDFLMTELP